MLANSLRRHPIDGGAPAEDPGASDDSDQPGDAQIAGADEESYDFSAPDDDFDHEFDGEIEIEDDPGDEGVPDAFDQALQSDAGSEPAGAADSAHVGAPASDEVPAAGADIEGLDLRADQVVAIDAAFEGIEGKSFYEVLLLPRNAEMKAVKRAYYRLSKEYHPDKFYRKKIGPYKDKLEAIFNKVTEAYRTLSDAESRKDYDALVLGKSGRDAASISEATATVDFVPAALREQQRSAAARKPEQKTAPQKKKAPPPVFIQKLQQQLATRIAKARKHMEEGERAMAQGRHGDAASNFQLAMTLDPRNVKAKALFTKCRSAHRNGKAEELYGRAREAMLAEDHKRAAQLLQEAVDCKPTRGKYYSAFAKLINEHTLQQRTALEHLKKAVEVEPRNVEYTMDLAVAYVELGMPTNAVRAYERVLRLEPKNSVATKALRRLK
jgi:curved DNA-binding protein CbpA